MRCARCGKKDCAYPVKPDPAAEERALADIQKAIEHLSVAHAVKLDAERDLSIAKKHYARARPLTHEERKRMARRVLSGKGLCCSDGLDWLKKKLKLPEIWANALNEWAYEALACNETRKDMLVHYADKVQNLKLDELP